MRPYKTGLLMGGFGERGRMWEDITGLAQGGCPEGGRNREEEHLRGGVYGCKNPTRGQVEIGMRRRQEAHAY